MHSSINAIITGLLGLVIITMSFRLHEQVTKLQSELVYVQGKLDIAKDGLTKQLRMTQKAVSATAKLSLQYGQSLENEINKLKNQLNKTEEELKTLRRQVKQSADKLKDRIEEKVKPKVPAVRFKVPGGM